jgi:pSer/pThr/pTyr-binding forkhead associated (FHA) protein
MEREAITKAQPALHRHSPSELKSIVDAENAGRPFLVIHHREGSHQVCMLTARRRLRIGRRPANDIVLNDAEVSRIHAELEPIGKDWAVSDMGLSSNGTFIGELRNDGDSGEVRISGRRRLVDGDVIRLGQTRITYRCPVKGATVPTAPASALTELGSLTARQRSILVALARPCRPGAAFAAPATNGQVAKELHLSLDAVKGHLTVLYKRFGIDDLPPSRKRMRLVECAFQWGLVSELEL